MVTSPSRTGTGNSHKEEQMRNDETAQEFEAEATAEIVPLKRGKKAAAPAKGKAAPAKAAKNGKGAKAAPVTKATRAKGTRVELTGKVQILVEENPRRGPAAERFAIYKNGMLVETAMEKGLSASDVRHDIAKGFIKLVTK